MTEANPTPDSLPDADASFANWFVSKRTPILAFALLAGLFWTILYLQFTVDDAWISFRYGKNLATHHIWNWNPTGPHEEAYTSAIYTALSVIPALLHLSPALFFKFIGLACIAAMLYRLRTFAGSQFAVLLGTLLITIHPWVWLHAYSALETPLYMLLILEMALAAHRAPTTSAAWVYTLFLLLPLTRPEGIVFSCAGIVLFWYARGAAPKHLLWFAAALSLGLLYFAVRWHYFQHFLPNPYYFKLAPASWTTLRDHFLYDLGESKDYFFVLILIALLARKTATRAFAVCAFLLLLLVYAPHAMHMNYADRFYFQVTFPILLFFLIAEDIAKNARIACVVAAVCLFATSVGDLRRELKYFPYLRESNLDVGRKLAPFAANHTLLTGDIGAIPYLSNWISYDVYGLGTYSIAHHGATVPQLQRFHPDLVFIESEEKGPGVIQESVPSGEGDAWNAPLQYLRESNEYAYVGATEFNGEYLDEFLRKDTPQFAEIARVLEQNTETSSQMHLSIKDLLLQRYVPWQP